MYTDVLLIDNGYPYRISEPFLKVEIDSDIFHGKNVYCLPLSPKRGDVLAVPDNVHLISFQRQCKLLQLFDLTAGALRTLVSGEFYKELALLLKTGRLNFSRFVTTLKFSVAAESKCISILRALRGIPLGAPSQLLIYSYWMHHHAYIAAKLKRKLPGALAVTRCHRYDLYEYRRSNDYIPFRKFILNSMDRVFPISKDGEEYLTAQYGEWIKDKVTLSYLGTVDHDINSRHEDDRLHVISCSNLVPVKRVALLIDALSEISDIEIDWTHYGDGELRASLEKRAADSLGNNIHWQFAGRFDNSALLEIYRGIQMDLFVNVSESEGLPVSIMEAMSFGVPVIATDVGGTSDIVADGVNGFLLTKDFEPMKLAELITRFAAMPPEERERYRNNARATWSERFDANRNFQLFYEQLEKLWEEKQRQNPK